MWHIVSLNSHKALIAIYFFKGSCCTSWVIRIHKKWIWNTLHKRERYVLYMAHSQLFDTFFSVISVRWLYYFGLSIPIHGNSSLRKERTRIYSVNFMTRGSSCLCLFIIPTTMLLQQLTKYVRADKWSRVLRAQFREMSYVLVSSVNFHHNFEEKKYFYAKVFLHNLQSYSSLRYKSWTRTLKLFRVLCGCCVLTFSRF